MASPRLSCLVEQGPREPVSGASGAAGAETRGNRSGTVRRARCAAPRCAPPSQRPQGGMMLRHKSGSGATAWGGKDSPGASSATGVSENGQCPKFSISCLELRRTIRISHGWQYCTRSAVPRQRAHVVCSPTAGCAVELVIEA